MDAALCTVPGLPEMMHAHIGTTGGVVLGTRRRWGAPPEPFGLRTMDRRRHLYVVGKTGSGKTTLLQNVAVQDLQAGRGLALIDPHGDLAEEVLRYVPPERVPDVIYFNPADLARPLGLNVLHEVPQDRRHLVASGVVAAFKSLWRDSWGPRMEYILYNALAALLDTPGSTLALLPRLLTDAAYRRGIVGRAHDPVVRSFWEDEFARYDARFRQEAIAPVQNKIGRFLSNAPVRNVVGQARSSFDAGVLMDESGVLVANLSKGALGEDKANFLGSLLVVQLEQAALARERIKEGERVDFFLIIDEFFNFTTDAFATLLSEARKYRLSLTLAHQYLGQLSEPVEQAVFGNVGSLLAFTVGGADAEVLEREFDREVFAHQFTALGRFRVQARVVERGETLPPFKGETLPATGVLHGRRAQVKRYSAANYGRDRAAVERKIHNQLTH